MDNSKGLTDHQLSDTGIDSTAQTSGNAAKAAEVAGRTVGAMKHSGSLLKNTGRAAGDKVKGGVNKAVEAFNKRHSTVTPNSTTGNPPSNSP